MTREFLQHPYNTLHSRSCGILAVLLGLELLETLKIYFREHRVRVEVIMIVSLIAVGRHVIQVDYAHVGTGQLLGLAVLMISLACGYFLAGKLNRSATDVPERDDVS